MEVHNPAHPGEIVREECLKPLGLTVIAAAEALGITRKALSDLLIRSAERPYWSFAGYGDPAGEGVRQHGRYRAADADAARSMGSPPARGRDQGQEAVCCDTSVLMERTEGGPSPRPSPRTAGRGRDP